MDIEAAEPAVESTVKAEREVGVAVEKVAVRVVEAALVAGANAAAGTEVAAAAEAAMEARWAV